MKKTHKVIVDALNPLRSYIAANHTHGYGFDFGSDGGVSPFITERRMEMAYFDDVAMTCLEDFGESFLFTDSDEPFVRLDMLNETKLCFDFFIYHAHALFFEVIKDYIDSLKNKSIDDFNILLTRKIQKFFSKIENDLFLPEADIEDIEYHTTYVNQEFWKNEFSNHLMNIDEKIHVVTNKQELYAITKADLPYGIFLFRKVFLFCQQKNYALKKSDFNKYLDEHIAFFAPDKSISAQMAKLYSDFLRASIECLVLMIRDIESPNERIILRS